MKRTKVTFLDEKKITEKAKRASVEFNKSEFVQNPIKASFSAFQKAKKNIKPDDLI